jgi:hypothetical protein
MLTFPTSLFAPGGFKPQRVGGSQSQGQSTSGIGQMAMTTGGHMWGIAFSSVVLWEPDLYKIWDAFCSASDNGATPFVVPMSTRISQPFVGPRTPDGVGNSDASTFSDGALWSGGEITAAIIGSAALRATSAHIAFTGGTDDLVGAYFTGWHAGIGQRLYHITGYSKRDDDTYDITFRPPLREATPDGFALDFDNPRCQMVVAPGADPSPSLELLKRGSAEVRFVEDFRPTWLL